MRVFLGNIRIFWEAQERGNSAAAACSANATICAGTAENVAAGRAQNKSFELSVILAITCRGKSLTVNNNGDERRVYSSPPCFMHELEPGFRPEDAGDVQTRADVMRWRKAERRRLIEARLAISAEERARMAAAIGSGLDAAIGNVKGRLVSLYWPFRGEPDLRPWANSVIGRGGSIALPVVIEKARPLIFREWKPGQKLEKGVWNIPVPVEGPEVTPEIVIAPVVGFDPANYRLGYGGGFFDRTLAGMETKPLVIGVGYVMSAIPTIYPQPHDIPMSRIITEKTAG
jgi:5,10-methenyltetrahydrofolate synthetase